MQLRKGKTKHLLQSSIDSALLAVEVYNKPRVTFRSEAYISLMIMAWTRLLQAHFNKIKGDKYYYKKNGRYEIVDGERRAWELKTCIAQYGKLTEPVKANLNFFIKLRNKIEHRVVEKQEIDIKIFGECQSFLYNYENELLKLFGEEYAINESLAFAIQFSLMRKDEQQVSNKRLLAREMVEINKFIESYRDSLSLATFTSQEYSVKLIQIPKIASASRHDLAVEFVRWEDLSKEDKENVTKLTAIIKEKVVTRNLVNPNCYKPGQVIKEVNKSSIVKIHQGDLRALLRIFQIRPLKKDVEDPFETNNKYCLYDGVHLDYVYTKEWIDFLITLINIYKWNGSMWRGKNRRNDFQSPAKYITN